MLTEKYLTSDVPPDLIEYNKEITFYADEAQTTLLSSPVTFGSTVYSKVLLQPSTDGIHVEDATISSIVFEQYSEKFPYPDYDPVLQVADPWSLPGNPLRFGQGSYDAATNLMSFNFDLHMGMDTFLGVPGTVRIVLTATLDFGDQNGRRRSEDAIMGVTMRGVVDFKSLDPRGLLKIAADGSAQLRRRQATPEEDDPTKSEVEIEMDLTPDGIDLPDYQRCIYGWTINGHCQTHFCSGLLEMCDMTGGGREIAYPLTVDVHDVPYCDLVYYCDNREQKCDWNPVVNGKCSNPQEQDGDLTERECAKVCALTPHCEVFSWDLASYCTLCLKAHGNHKTYWNTERGYDPMIYEFGCEQSALGVDGKPKQLKPHESLPDTSVHWAFKLRAPIGSFKKKYFLAALSNTIHVAESQIEVVAINHEESGLRLQNFTVECKIQTSDPVGLKGRLKTAMIELWLEEIAGEQFSIETQQLEQLYNDPSLTVGAGIPGHAGDANFIKVENFTTNIYLIGGGSVAATIGLCAYVIWRTSRRRKRPAGHKKTCSEAWVTQGTPSPHKTNCSSASNTPGTATTPGWKDGYKTYRSAQPPQPAFANAQPPAGAAYASAQPPAPYGNPQQQQAGSAYGNAQPPSGGAYANPQQRQSGGGYGNAQPIAGKLAAISSWFPGQATTEGSTLRKPHKPGIERQSSDDMGGPWYPGQFLNKPGYDRQGSNDSVQSTSVYEMGTWDPASGQYRPKPTINRTSSTESYQGQGYQGAPGYYQQGSLSRQGSGCQRDGEPSSFYDSCEPDRVQPLSSLTSSVPPNVANTTDRYSTRRYNQGEDSPNNGWSQSKPPVKRIQSLPYKSPLQITLPYKSPQQITLPLDEKYQRRAQDDLALTNDQFDGPDGRRRLSTGAWSDSETISRRPAFKRSVSDPNQYGSSKRVSLSNVDGGQSTNYGNRATNYTQGSTTNYTQGNTQGNTRGNTQAGVRGSLREMLM